MIAFFRSRNCTSSRKLYRACGYLTACVKFGFKQITGSCKGRPNATHQLTAARIIRQTAFQPRTKNQTVPAFHAISGKTAAFFYFAYFIINDFQVINAARLLTLEPNGKLRPAFRVLPIHRFQAALLIAQRGKRIQNAALGAAPLRDNTLHCKPGTIVLDILAQQSRHIAILSVYRKHRLGRAGNVSLVTNPEKHLFQVIKLMSDNSKKDEKLIQCLFAFFKRCEQQIKHILIEMLKPFHTITTFPPSPISCLG